MPRDPLEEYIRAEAKRTQEAQFTAFRKKHRLSDARIRAMLKALKDGSAQTLEEAYERTEG